MSQSPLEQAVKSFGAVMLPLPDSALDTKWVWHAHDEEGIRFTFFRTYQILHDLAVRIIDHRTKHGPAITTASRILALHHRAYRDLYGVLAGARPGELDKAPAEGEWPLRTVLLHVSEAETGFLLQIEFALERQRGAGGQARRMTKDEFEAAISRPQYQGLDDEGGEIEDILARYDGLHSYILTTLHSLRDEELEYPSMWWEDEPFPIRYRMHRWAAHLFQHTVQAEKTLVDIGHPPSETERLMRQIYLALGEVEGALIGAPDALSDTQQGVADEIRHYAKQVSAALNGK